MQDIGRLAALVAVAEHGSITRAASHLGYTPAALSQQLAKLEREVGTPLLVRHHGGSELTPGGDALLPYAREIIELTERARRELASLQKTITGRIQIGTFATAAVHLLPAILTAFGRAHPRVNVSLQEYEPPAGVKAVASGVVDLALTHEYDYGMVRDTPRGLRTEVLVREPLLLVAGIDQARSWGDGPLPVVELAKCSLITGAVGLANRDALEALFRLHDLPQPSVVFETADYTLACALSSAGMGVALVPEMAVEDVPAHPIVTLRLTPPLHRTISMVWRGDDPSPALRALRLLIRRSFAGRAEGRLAESGRRRTGSVNAPD